MRSSVNIWFSGITDIQVVFPVGACLRPYPHICYILVTGVSVQPALNGLFQIGAVRTCRNRIVPTIHRRTFQPQPYAVSCEGGADTTKRSVFAQPERESASNAKTAMILAFFICANLLCSFIVRITAGNCKAARTAAAVLSLFSGSTGSFEGVRCGEGEHADTAIHPLKMGMAAPW